MKKNVAVLCMRYLAICLFCLLCLFAVSAHAQNAASEPPKAVQDPYVVPEGKTAEELLEYAVKTLQENQPTQDMDREKMLETVTRQAEFLLKTADTALTKDPSDELKKQIYMMKFDSLEHLARTNKPEWVERLEKYLDELDKLMPKSREAKMMRAFDLQRQVGLFMQLNPTQESFEKLKKTVMDLIMQEPLNFPPGLPMNLISIAELAEQVLEKDGIVDSTSLELIELLKKSGDPGLESMVARVEAAIHLLGQDFQLEGLMLDGKKFDIKDLKGKVVLVDFFTSWCGPCIAEIPHMKAQYEKYKTKGFEIVGVGIDEAEKIQKIVDDHKIPWTIVSEEKTVEKKLPSMEKLHNIRSYPTMFLIDREGKLIKNNARGPRLEQALEEQFK